LIPAHRGWRRQRTARRGARRQVWAELAPADAEFLRAELGYFGAVTGVSGALYPVPKDQRRAAAGELVRKARATRPRRGRSRPGRAWLG